MGPNFSHFAKNNERKHGRTNNEGNFAIALKHESHQVLGLFALDVTDHCYCVREKITVSL
jgi:hypothetical protein